MNELTVTSLVYLAGTIFVIIFAARYFNDKPYQPNDENVKNALSSDPRMEPALPRYVTEKTRYHIYLNTFIFLTVVLYYILSLLFPSLISNILGKDIQASFSVALVIGTLAFINLSTKIPYVKKTLNEWKSDLHKRAKIPDKGMYVFDSLRFSGINTSSEQFNKNLAKILNEHSADPACSDIEEDYFHFDKDRIERKWARLVYLMHAVEKWSTNQQFERHLKAESLKWLMLRAYYHDNLTPRMIKFRQGELDDAQIQETKEAIDILSIKIYWMITLLLFMANKAAEDPSIHLKSIGWIVSPDKYFKFSGRQILFTGSIIFISILIGSAISAVLLLEISAVDHRQFTIKPSMIFYWLIYGIPMFIMPLAVTLLAKRYLSMNGVWGVQRPEEPGVPFDRRSWGIYFIVGITSYVVTFSILAAIYYIVTLFREPVTSNAIPSLGIYSGLAFISSIFISYLIDTPYPGWETNWRYYLKSLVPALLQGTTNVLLVGFAFLFLNNNQSFDITDLNQEQLGRLIVYSVIVFIIGAAMYITSRIGTQYYERRVNGTSRTTQGWWTIYINSIRKRVQTISLPDHKLDIHADDELKELASIGDTIEFYNRNKLAMTGSIQEVNGRYIRVTLPV